jgi:hypothetical protein
MLIQVALILLGLVLVYLILASRGSHGAKASMKVGLILLVIAMIVTVLNPDLTTRLAKFVGVGRGTDLLLYVVTGAFLFYVLTQYLKSQSQRDVTVRLARRIALLEADQRYAAALAGTATGAPGAPPEVPEAPADPQGTGPMPGQIDETRLDRPQEA